MQEKIKMKTFSKKGEGFLESEVVKIIIAVICISFLIYFAFLLYQSSREKNENRQAKSTLEEINMAVEKLNNSGQIDYLYLAPKGYYFRVADENNKLTQCTSTFCICLCNEDDCSDLNVCQKTQKLFIMDGGMTWKKIETPNTYILTDEKEYYRIKEAL